MLVKTITKKDIDSVVKIHKLAFKSFFLSEMGDSFLKLYYRSILRSKKSVFFGCYEGNNILGFCTASTLSKGFNKSLIMNNIISFSFQSIIIFFTRPKAFVHFYRNLSKKDKNFFDDFNYAELYSIGVLPSMQGKGIGRALLSDLEKDLKQLGCNKLSLTTDSINNEKALSFYKGIGYEVLYKFTAYPDREMFRLIKSI